MCHSFGTRTDGNGFAAWFHYLCKGGDSKVRYGWHKAGFFLRKDTGGNVALVCFGDITDVRIRLEECVKAGYWTDLQDEPLALFDLVLYGLFSNIDKQVWRMVDDITQLEKDVQVLPSRATKQIEFPALYNWAKDIIHLKEAVSSCLLVVDGTLSCIGKSHPASTTPSAQSDQLQDCLKYRCSLFNSTKIRIESVQQRVNNTMTLAFNIVTQQDSKIMQRDSASVTIISFITVFFLPTAGVAAVVGSDLFQTEFDRPDGQTSIYVSPLFSTMWWVAVPLTLATLGIAIWYRWFFSVSQHTGKGGPRAALCKWLSWWSFIIPKRVSSPQDLLRGYRNTPMTTLPTSR